MSSRISRKRNKLERDYLTPLALIEKKTYGGYSDAFQQSKLCNDICELDKDLVSHIWPGDLQFTLGRTRVTCELSMGVTSKISFSNKDGNYKIVTSVWNNGHSRYYSVTDVYKKDDKLVIGSPKIPISLDLELMGYVIREDIPNDVSVRNYVDELREEYSR